MHCFLKLELNAILFPKENEIIICNGSFGSFTFSSKMKWEEGSYRGVLLFLCPGWSGQARPRPQDLLYFSKWWRENTLGNAEQIPCWLAHSYKQEELWPTSRSLRAGSRCSKSARSVTARAKSSSKGAIESRDKKDSFPPDRFTLRRSRATHCLLSNREGLGTSL